MIATTTDKPRIDQLTASDTKRLFVISVRQSGQDFIAYLNGRELRLPAGLPSIYDARKVAVEIAIKEISAAAKDLIDKYFE